MNINPPDWEGYAENTSEEDDFKLTDFENLILIKSFREEKVSGQKRTKKVLGNSLLNPPGVMYPG